MFMYVFFLNQAILSLKSEQETARFVKIDHYNERTVIIPDAGFRQIRIIQVNLA